MPLQIEADVSIRMQQYFRYCGMKHITGISQNPIGEVTGKI